MKKFICYLLNYSEHGSELAAKNLSLIPIQTKAYIEKVHSMPAQGVVSSFKFGRSYGFLRGLLIALKIPFEEVTPQRWQKEFVTKRTKTESRTDHKNKLKGKAQQLFPQIKVTLAIADAMLIGQYGYMKENNAKRIQSS